MYKPMRIRSDANPPTNMPLPDMGSVPKTNIEIRLSAEKKDADYAVMFVAGTQGRIVESSEELTDNIGGYELFLKALISDAHEAYLEVDRLGVYDCIWVRKLNTTEVLLQIYELGYGESGREDDEFPSLMYVEAVVGYRKLVWELYTSFITLPKVAKSFVQNILPSPICFPEVEKWLGMEHEADWHRYPDDIYGDEPMGTPWAR
ncbi:hypothetical protein [Kordiimonas pumila]|uniref:Uncharacterized protein n=1 Tax=Kordiimonas pumila TaxID=2161677 RepID=A0ABV7D3C4_9PROT|nr:hypothetical protein [Kordiimonas pumila]